MTLEPGFVPWISSLGLLSCEHRVNPYLISVFFLGFLLYVVELNPK